MRRRDLLRRGATGLGLIAAAALPTPLRDKLTPVEGLDIVDREMKAVYAEAGHSQRWKLLRYDVGHEETAEGRGEVLAFLRAFL